MSNSGFPAENGLGETRRFDGIGCVSLLLLITLILFIMGTVIAGSESPSNDVLAAITAEQLSPVETLDNRALVTVTATDTLQPTDTPEATVTSTYTLAPTATNTATASSTATGTATETATAFPPTPTMTLEPTVTETPLPAPTETPQPLPTPQGTFSWTLKVPILMYHYISIPPEDADEYRLALSVTPTDFRQQMRYLAENGYSTVDLYDLSLAITNKQELPPRPVIITIDDGYRDNYVNAFPILQEYGLTATIFLVTEFVDQAYDAYLSWGMIEEMARAGIRFEPHSKTHPDLRGQDRDYVIYQILGSQETIAAHVGYMPRYFAYPSGSYDDETIQVLKDLSFWGAVTTWSGKWHGFTDRYAWTRLRVRDNTALPEFVDLVVPGDTQSGKPLDGG